VALNEDVGDLKGRHLPEQLLELVLGLARCRQAAFVLVRFWFWSLVLCHGETVRARAGQYADLVKVPNGYCPNHATGGRPPDGVVVTPLQYVD